jgi:hypothetical protein
MAFKMKGSPMARNYGAPFNQNEDTKERKADDVAVRRAKGTEASKTLNLLNVLSEVGTDGQIDSYKRTNEDDAERQHYEKQVTSKYGNTPDYRGDGGTSQMDVAVSNARKSDDAWVESGGGKTPGLNQSKDEGEYYRTNQSDDEVAAIASAEARDKAKAKAANEMIVEQATKRTGKNVAGKEAQVRIDTKAAEDTEKARYNALSRSERGREDRAKEKSAMPKSGFKMHRKGNYGK